MKKLVLVFATILTVAWAGPGFGAGEGGGGILISNQLYRQDVVKFAQSLPPPAGASGVEVLGVHQEGNHADLYLKYQVKAPKTGEVSEAYRTLSVVRFNSGKWYHPDSHTFLTK
ncbi:MAG: hypothetical protein ABIJ95_03630 [Pseudomonadota bacterium]